MLKTNTSGMPRFQTGLVWFRRDLRATDNAALHHALDQCAQVHAVFVLDRDILDPLPRRDRRVDFILGSLHDLDAALRTLSGLPEAGLIVRHGHATHEVSALARELGAQAVFANHDDEPAAIERDNQVRTLLAQHGQDFFTFKDHVVFERQEVLTQSGTPYGVFTPYKNAWLKKLQPAEHLSAWPIEALSGRLAARSSHMRQPPPKAQDIGFEPSNLADLPVVCGAAGAQQALADFLNRIDRYEDTRNFPAVKGPSYLSVHLRFGTVSIRELASLAHARVQQGSAGAAVWLSELIWRDFYHQILYHHPRVVAHAFKPDYDRIQWESGSEAQALFDAWCAGRTGYPLVDAAMAQINQTGYMHNRLRMVVASFLVKDLGLDWRWGERYFAQHLIDFDLAANNGGWQWASSSGCDAQPYFRIFNPISQSEKFDPQGKFIRRYQPQLAEMPERWIHAPWQAPPMVLQAAGVRLGENQALPVVDHAVARDATLARYAVVKKPGV
jgi:deoxyribodipyrimidine photo-lyase